MSTQHKCWSTFLLEDRRKAKAGWGEGGGGCDVSIRNIFIASLGQISHHTIHRRRVILINDKISGCFWLLGDINAGRHFVYFQIFPSSPNILNAHCVGLEKNSKSSFPSKITIPNDKTNRLWMASNKTRVILTELLFLLSSSIVSLASMWELYAAKT